MAALYLPPGSPALLYQDHCQSVEYAASRHPRANILLVGDYNLPHIDWRSDDINLAYVERPGALAGEIKAASIILTDLGGLGLYQYNTCENSYGGILDLIFSSASRVLVSGPAESLLRCDAYHPPLEVHLGDQGLAPCIDYKCGFYDYKNADYCLMNNYFATVHWDEILSVGSLDLAVSSFNLVVHDAITRFVPWRARSSSSYPRWVSGYLRHLIGEKKRAHALYKSSGMRCGYPEFRALRSRCKLVSNLLYQGFIDRVQANLQTNIKAFWNFANADRAVRGIPERVFLEGRHAEDREQIADLFASHFKSVYSSEPSITAPCVVSGSDVSLSSVSVSLADVFEGLRALDTNKGPGPDGVPPMLLRSCCCTLAPPLHVLFMRSLQLGVVPGDWKSSSITPVFKAGDGASVRNYRPISILSTIPKLLEKLIMSQIAPVFRSVIIPEQDGFCEGRSTVSNLAIYTGD